MEQCADGGAGRAKLSDQRVDLILERVGLLVWAGIGPIPAIRGQGESCVPWA